MSLGESDSVAHNDGWVRLFNPFTVPGLTVAHTQKL